MKGSIEKHIIDHNLQLLAFLFSIAGRDPYRDSKKGSLKRFQEGIYKTLRGIGPKKGATGP